MKLGFLAAMVVAVLVAMCAVSPRVEPSAERQRHDCGNLPADLCEEAIAAAIEHVPHMVNAPIAVTATLHPNQLSRRGGDMEVLVGFAPPAGDSDVWSPSAWLATRGMLSSVWRVGVWREGPLPDHFLALMRENGLDL